MELNKLYSRLTELYGEDYAKKQTLDRCLNYWLKTPRELRNETKNLNHV